MKQRVIALGFFDGVHLGHGALLRRTRELADRFGLTAAALTFDVHPDTLVSGTDVRLINTFEERVWLIKSLYGIDEVLTLHFDEQVMRQPWEQFVLDTLCGTYQAAYVVCGHDFRFGAGGEGTPQRLTETCRRLGIGCDCISQVRMDGKAISSTMIRQLLEAGATAQAVRLLGHPHIIFGTVVGGQHIGHTIGIPTANLVLQERVLIPRFGVYAAKAYVADIAYTAVVNIGVRPTVGGQTITVEPWLLDFEGNLYGADMRLELYTFLRPEQKFASLEALKAEILRNAQQTRDFFTQGRSNQ